MHGAADETVPVGQADLLADALRAAGVAVTYLRVAGGRHHFRQAIAPAEEQDAGYWPRVIHDLLPADLEAQVVRFLEGHLAHAPRVVP